MEWLLFLGGPLIYLLFIAFFFTIAYYVIKAAVKNAMREIQKERGE
jgi:hypothetical protein